MLSANHLDYMITDLALYRFYTSTTICLPDFGIICPLKNNLEVQYHYIDDANTLHSLQLHPHDFFVFQTGLPVTLIPDDMCIYLMIRLNPAFLLNLFSADRFSSLPVCHLASQFSADTLYAILNMSHLYVTNKGKNEFQIISNLYNTLDSFFPPVVPLKKSSQLRHSEKRKELILSYIENHIQDTSRQNETARALGLTPQYLSAWFQKNFDCTFSNYILNKKIEAVKLWLRYTSISEAEIAEQFHFKSVDILQNAMFQQCGLSLFKYRETFQKKETLSLPDSGNKLPLSPYYDELLSTNLTHTPSSTDIFPVEEDIHKISHKSVRYCPNSWRYLLNMGYAYQFNDNRMLIQLRKFQKEVHFKYGRICRLLDLTTLHSINHTTRYGFENIFLLLDDMLQLDLIPFIELGYKHAKIHFQFHETQILTMDEEVCSYYDKLIQILPDFLRACCNRYGIETVKLWEFSVYYDFIKEYEHLSTITFRQYMDYYQTIRSIIKSLVPEAKIGGADFNIFLPFELWEDKFRTLQDSQITMDFITINAYGGVMTDSEIHLSLDSDYMSNKIKKATRLINTYFPSIPVLITEFSFCYTSRNYLNDMIFSSCFLASFLIENMHLVKGMGYFTMSDLSVSYSDSWNLFFGGNGLFNYIGIPKPTYHIYKFFRELGTQIIGHSSDYLITTNSNYHFQALFINYVHINEEAAYDIHNKKLLDTPEQLFAHTTPQTLHIQIEQAVPGTYLFKTYTVNAFNGNILSYWAKCSSITHLSKQDYETFEQLAQPGINLYTKNVSSDELLDFTVHLEPLEVKLILIDYIEN